MHNSKHTFVAAAALMALGLSQAAHSQTGASCADLVFTEDITSRLPNPNAACLGVVEKDGRQYAKFAAEIVRVRGGEVRAKFKRPDGTFTDTYSFNPDRSARVRIRGRSYRYSDLARGQELDIYLPADRWEIATHSEEEVDFAAAAAVTTVAVVKAEPEPEMAALPSTASLVPLMGLLGAIFMALGTGLVMVRRWIRRS